MRNIYLILLLPVFTVSLKAQTNRALIVAISDYPEESGWEKIHATNDCKLVVPMLNANGYKNSNITILSDKKATKALIVKELQQLASKTRSGDFIYIHFSGHGQQMIDDNGDEEDGLDEAFIPYDARFRFKPEEYEGENHLRDDEIELHIDAIRHRAGANGNLIVVMDACHSGKGTRIPDDDEYIRGTSYIFAPDNFKTTVLADSGVLRSALKREPGLSPVAVYSACLPDEVNYEYKHGNPETFFGRLTYFFCRLVMESTVSSTNYSFYVLLKEEMNQSFEKKNRKQTPYFESTNNENIFFIGRTYGNDN